VRPVGQAGVASAIAGMDGELFEGGPPNKLQRWLGLVRKGRPRVLLRIILALALGWLPLVVLSFVHGDLLTAGPHGGFLPDFGAQARFLIAVPLLILAEGFCLPQLSALAFEFVRTGVVAEEDYPRYQQIIASTRHQMSSMAAEVIAVLLAYLLVAALVFGGPPIDLAVWHGALGAGNLILTPAGWWSTLVSLPLLLLLELGWVWRVFLWARFLWHTSRMPLRLNPAHPDAAAGIGFLNYSLRAFVPLGAVIGVLAAGRALNGIMHEGISPAHYKLGIAGTVVAAVCIYTSPLLVFLPRLVQERRRGTFLYGALAAGMGRAFEERWFVAGQPLDKSALAASDFSATTDLYSIVANVYRMQGLPLQLRDLVLLTVATLLPFIPVVFLVAPLDVIVAKLTGLFL
jgi:hypothetical protein